MIPILQMRKLRLNEDQRLADGQAVDIPEKARYRGVTFTQRAPTASPAA